MTNQIESTAQTVGGGLTGASLFAYATAPSTVSLATVLMALIGLATTFAPSVPKVIDAWRGTQYRDQIADLRAEVAELKGRLAAMSPAPAPSPG